MHDRLSDPRKIGIGYVPNHTITFNRRGSYRSGGVASIVKQPGERTYGIIWSLTKADIELLDKIEDPTAYHRRKKFVVDEDGRKRLCCVYVATPEGKFDADPAYLELIIAAAIKQELPPEWIEKLKNFR